MAVEIARDQGRIGRSLQPWRMMLLLSLPSFITAGIVLYERSLGREAWLAYSASVPGKVIGALGIAFGFVLAPLGLFMLLGYAMAASRKATKSAYVQWLCFACSLAAYLIFLDALRGAVLGFEMRR